MSEFFIQRVVFEDQFPKHADLAQQARDSMLRYARHHSLLVTSGITVQHGQKWRRDPHWNGGEWPLFWMPGAYPTMVSACKATAYLRKR